jgi:hypothetical protein
MKSKIFIILLALLLIFSLVACGGDMPCTEHVDEDEDGICDECEDVIEGDDGGDGEEEEKPEGTLLIGEGEVKFAFVLSKSASANTRIAINDLKDALSEKTDAPEIQTLGSEKGFDAYIYVGIELGDVFDGYTLGAEGYTVIEKDGNIVVSAGSEEKLSEAIEYLKEKLFDKWDGDGELLFTEKHAVTKETRYRTLMVVGDRALSEYSVVAEGEALVKTIAVNLIETLYTRTGARLKLVEEADGAKILIRQAAEVKGGGFRVYEKDGDVIIECAYKNRFEEAVEKFLSDKLKPGTVDLDGIDYSLSIDTVYYADFGAKGDGVTDDFDAIKAAHDFANESGLKVKAKAGATYYIKNMKEASIIVKTSTDFAGASFIIDDTEISRKNEVDVGAWDVFIISSDYSTRSFTEKNSDAIKALNEKEIAIERDNVTKLDLGLGYPALLKVTNANVRHYIRYGGNANSGSAQCELILVDSEGNIDPTTPFLFDFEKVTKIEAIRIDDKPIEITNGKFTTLATKVQDTSGSYILRGMRVVRANTTVSKIEHYVEGEIPEGKIVDGVAFCANGYSGFYRAENTTNVEYRDCIATGHVSYNSSYDITTKYANDVRFINVKQTEENYLDNALWWIMGSNFCKNLYYDGCYLTRFDAHCGVYNATIKNSTIASLRLTGGGDFLIENSTVKAKSYGGDTFIMLREDYGSTWRGNITIRNCVFDNINAKSKYETVAIIYGEWVNHNFGYQTTLPNLYIDNLRFAENLGVKKVNLFTIVNKDADFKKVTNYSLASLSGKKNNNVYVPPEVISIKNCDTRIDFVMPTGDFYKKTKIEK